MARTIAHVDLNACFASLEQQSNPRLRGRPTAVVRKAQRVSVISAPSYEAKRRGVRTGMTTPEAKRRCPELRVLLEDPTKYLAASERFFELLHDLTGAVETFSIDEGFADLAHPLRRLGDPVWAAERIKREIRHRLGEWMTVSIGVGPSKVVAKLAGQQRKPDGLVRIQEDEVPNWLETLAVDEACGIAERTKDRLAAMGIRTLADLGRADVMRLRQAFGINGYFLHLIGQGKDPVPFQAGGAPPRQGFGHGRVLPWPWPDFAGARDWLQVLCHMVARRMRAHGNAARVVHLGVESADGWGSSKQRCLPVATDDEQVVVEACRRIAEGLERQGRLPQEIQYIGVSVSKLYDRTRQPLPLFPQGRARHRLIDAMDTVNDRFGDLSVYFGGLHEGQRKMTVHAANRGMYRDLQPA